MFESPKKKKKKKKKKTTTTTARRTRLSLSLSLPVFKADDDERTTTLTTTLTKNASQTPLQEEEEYRVLSVLIKTCFKMELRFFRFFFFLLGVFPKMFLSHDGLANSANDFGRLFWVLPLRTRIR